MKYCKKCVMPDTRPSISFNEKGGCSVCQEYEKRKLVDWDTRWKEFEAICDKYWEMNGNGHAAATDYAARMIWYGMITRKEGVDLVQTHDHNLDPLCVRDFCEFCGYTETEFWKIVDSLYNEDLFERNAYGKWVLKNPVWGE